MFFVLLLFIKSPSTDPNVLWFCFNCSKRRNIFRENFFKIGNSRRNIKLLVTGYVINYLTADCHIPNRKGGNGRGILTPWANACCEFPNRPKPLMLHNYKSKCPRTYQCPRVSVYFEIETCLQLMNMLWIVILTPICIFICCAFAGDSYQESKPSDEKRKNQVTGVIAWQNIIGNRHIHGLKENRLWSFGSRRHFGEN